MDQNEVKYDKLLKIKTTGRNDADRISTVIHTSQRRTGCWNGWLIVDILGKKNHLIDYGCGKGRVDFFLAWQVRCRTTGVEYDERMTKAAEENRQRAVSGQKHHLYWRMQLFFRYRNPQTDFIFSIPFLWKY